LAFIQKPTELDKWSFLTKQKIKSLNK
jgi:hypothetical protein